MKKIVLSLISIMLCVVLSLTLVSCKVEAPNGNYSTESTNSVVATPDSTTEIIKDEFETENIHLAEGVFKDNENNFKLINSSQGSITFLDNGNTFPAFVSNNKLYINSYGKLTSYFELEDNPDEILFFNNNNYGYNLFTFKDNKISHLSESSGSTFKNIKFNPEEDFIFDVKIDDSFNVVSRDDTGLIINNYKKNSNNTYEFTESYSAEFYDVKENSIDIVKTQVVKSSTYGYMLYCYTKDNEIYTASSISQGKILMTSSTPVATDVNKIIACSDIATRLSCPIYHKIDDEKQLHAKVYGKSLSKTDDDLDISFVIPDEHKIEEIVNVFSCSDSIVFIFNNGDVYITSELDEFKTETYKMKKLEEVSKLNAENKIVSLSGCRIIDDNIYFLLENGKIYYCKVK